jgi:hypothetical protein
MMPIKWSRQHHVFLLFSLRVLSNNLSLMLSTMVTTRRSYHVKRLQNGHLRSRFSIFWYWRSRVTSFDKGGQRQGFECATGNTREGNKILCGIPRGVFQTLTITYASEVYLVALREYLTTHVHFCRGLAQVIGIRVTKSMLGRADR